MRVLLGAAFVLAVCLAPGCGWTRLAFQAWNYPVAARGEARNLALDGEVAYAALGEDGIGVFDARTGALLRMVAPPSGLESVDDLSRSGRRLFVLDAVAPGHLAVLELPAPAESLAAPSTLVPIDAVPVPVGPFSGVAAASGRVLVSGGTSELTAFTLDGDGALRPAGTLDLGRGQPDVALRADGALALVSTHFHGPRFGVCALALDERGRPQVLGSLELDGAGFTAGGAHPASFPLVAAPAAAGTWVVGSGAGLTLVRMSADGLVRLDHVELEPAPVHVAVEGDVVAAVGSKPCPALIELRVDGERLVHVRTHELPRDARPTAVAIGPDRFVIAAGGAGLIPLARGTSSHTRTQR